MRRSESIAKIGEAQAKAQAAIENATKAAENPGFKRGQQVSRYADLAAIWDACRLPLSENGLAVFQSPCSTRDDKGNSLVTVTTLLTHSSGEWIENELSAPSSAPTPQAIGSAITYLRRYALAALVGVAPEDDDGNASSGVDAHAGRPEGAEPERHRSPPKPAPRQQPDHPEMTEAEKARAFTLAARDRQIFEEAVKGGIRQADFHAWAETILAHPYASNTAWTEQDRVTLEAEIRTRKDLGGGARA